MTLGIPCNPCANGACGNCVADKLEIMGFIQNASFHCSCVNNGHKNKVSKELPNKAVFSKKRDTDPVHTREIQSDSDDEYREEE